MKTEQILVRCVWEKVEEEEERLSCREQEKMRKDNFKDKKMKRGEGGQDGQSTVKYQGRLMEVYSNMGANNTETRGKTKWKCVPLVIW